MRPKSRHYSFDLWMTLIRSDPAYKKARTAWFHQRYNPLNKSLDDIDRIFRSVDRMANAVNECTGLNLHVRQLYSMVLWEISNETSLVESEELEALINTMDELVFKHRPILYCSKTNLVLQNLHEQGCRMNLLSNTGFIRGRILRGVLDELGLGKYFNFQLYSDELELSKPSPELFERMIYQAMSLDGKLVPKHICHVGDNPQADLAGAQKAGISAVLVNSNQTCISILLA